MPSDHDAPVGPVVSDPAKRGGAVLIALALLAVVAIPVAFFLFRGSSSEDDDGAVRSEGPEQLDGTDGESGPTVAAAGEPETVNGASESSDGASGPSDDGSDAAPSSAESDPADAGELDLLRGSPAAAFDDLRAVVGTSDTIVSLVVYDTYLIVEYRDPDEPANVDRRIWRDGTLNDADPEGFSADFEGQFFDLATIDPEVLSDLAERSLAEFELPGAEVTHIIIDRFFGLDDGSVGIRVYVRHPQRGGGGYVLARTDGTIIRVV